MSASPETARARRPGRWIAAAAALAVVAAMAGALASTGAEPGLDPALGHALFQRAWVSAPASTTSTDGLGPLYNARSCASCHGAGRRLPTDAAGQAVPSAILFKLAGPHGPDPTYGAQLQTAGVHGLPAEGRVEVGYQEIPVTLADGRTVSLRKPSYRLVDPGYGPLDPATLLSPRLPPSLAGAGLLERIDAAAILAGAAAEQASGGAGHPGRPAACAGKPDCVGRFGWKAGAATIDEQVSLAFSLDLGLSTPLHPAPWGDCTPREAACVAAPHGADPATGETEIAPSLLALVEAFVRGRPPPPRHEPDGALVAAGAAVFADAGCSACHRPSFTIAAADGGSQTIAPYSDLLLHDLGDGLRDVPGIAGDWRTAPLWGLGTIERSAAKAYLHDGRARSLEEAILWHGGEATASRAAARALTTDQWNALLAFLRSL